MPSVRRSSPAQLRVLLQVSAWTSLTREAFPDHPSLHQVPLLVSLIALITVKKESLFVGYGLNLTYVLDALGEHWPCLFNYHYLSSVRLRAWHIVGTQQIYVDWI